MKKLIIILSILILVACSVFAEEKQTIKITTKVDSSNPTYSLNAGLSPDSFSQAASEDDAVHTLGWEAVEKSIQKEDIEVYFQIVQKGITRVVGQKFSLSIEASEMILGMNEDGTVLSPDAKIHKTTKGTISEVTPMNSEKTNVAVTIVESPTKDAISLVTEYKGKVDEGTPIATFTVTWAKDINAPDGIYQASVILKVSPL